MTAEYTLAVVYRDGVPRDIQTFGIDKGAGLRRLQDVRHNANPHREHFMLYDANDEERGYFEPTDA